MSWKRSFGDRNTRFEYQVTVPAGVDSASVSDRRTTTPESVEDPFERVSQKVAEQDSFPSWAAEDPEEPPVKTIVRSRAQMERLRKVTERYNLPIPNEYATFYGPEKEPHRVHRPTRMRIHRTCHRCNAMFRGARICPQCQHQACALCQATPQPRYLSSWDPIVDDPLAVDLEVDDYHGMQQQVVVTRAANRANPQLLVRKELRQRVRRTCHSCQTLFTSRNRICTNCQHFCCTECPRFPPKRRKYPDGYPGDEPASSSTAPIRYACHLCRKSYPPVPHPDSPEGQAIGDAAFADCVRCGHTRCPSCRRAPPRTAPLAPTPSPPPEPALDPDPDVLRSVEAKLAAIEY